MFYLHYTSLFLPCVFQFLPLVIIMSMQTWQQLLRRARFSSNCADVGGGSQTGRLTAWIVWLRVSVLLYICKHTQKHCVSDDPLMNWQTWINMAVKRITWQTASMMTKKWDAVRGWMEGTASKHVEIYSVTHLGVAVSVLWYTQKHSLHRHTESRDVNSMPPVKENNHSAVPRPWSGTFDTLHRWQSTSGTALINLYNFFVAYICTATPIEPQPQH